jgi:YD repeat-containing protein
VARASSPPPVRPLESLYDEYVRAKRDNGESTERLSYDAFARSVEKKVQPGGTLSVAKREGRVTLVLRREGPR